ncbi:MAG: hydrogenase maturation nickel metallochaperone HypA/HybF, partial [Thermoguttaceae bacterium]
MHEVAIVEELIEQVEGEVARAGASGRVTRLALSIGRLSGVQADSIRFAFELLTPGTRLEGSSLE